MLFVVIQDEIQYYCIAKYEILYYLPTDLYKANYGCGCIFSIFVYFVIIHTGQVIFLDIVMTSNYFIYLYIL